MKILSVDFDFFQDVSTEQLEVYPDGVDNSTLFSEVIWASHYNAYGEQINRVGIMKDELNKAKTLVKNQNRDIPVRVSQSHKEIYSFIHRYADFTKEVSITNIDMHHDIFNDNEQLDCGNWLSHITNETKSAGGKFSLKWIANPVSKEMYGLKDFAGSEAIAESIGSILNRNCKNFDMLFLCRSDTWLPPHLDKYFLEFLSVIENHFCNAEIEENMFYPRTSYTKIANKLHENDI